MKNNKAAKNNKPMQKKEELKQTYNKIAEDFDKTRYKIWDEINLLLTQLPKKSKILDLAAGSGRHAIYAKCKGFDVYCSDFSQKQLKTIKNKDETIPLIISDLEQNPFQSNTFDAIMYIAAIHHLQTEEKRINSLINAKKILKKDGLILVSAWSINAPKFKKENIKNQDIILQWNKKHPRFYHLFIENELEQLVKKAGFTILESKNTDWNFWVLAKK